MDQYQITITITSDEIKDKALFNDEIKTICRVLSKDFVISNDLIITHNNLNDVNYEKNFKLLEKFLQIRYKDYCNIVLSTLS